MSKDIQSRIQSDIHDLSSTEASRNKSKKFWRELAIGAVFVSAASFGIDHFVQESHDYTERDEVVATIEDGTYETPTQFYLDQQEECIREELDDEEGLDLDNMSQDEVLALRSQFSGQLECSGEDFNEKVQELHVKSLEPTEFFTDLKYNTLVYSGMYLAISGFFAYRRRSAGKALERRQNDLKLLK